MNIKKEYLGGGIYVFCSDTHRFGTDAVLLEAFAMQTNATSAKPKSIIDLGCGCGIIPMLFARDTKDSTAKITALDIQSEAAELTQKAVDYNKLGERVRVINADLNDIAAQHRDLHGGFELVTMNPPYKRQGSGLMTENEGLNIARFELKCDFDGICKAAKLLLKNKGRFCVCNRPSRLADMIFAMKNNGIEPKRLQNVAQRQGDKPMLVLLEGIVGANADMTVLPTLYLEDNNGKMTADCAKIYEKWEYERKNSVGRES